MTNEKASPRSVFLGWALTSAGLVGLLAAIGFVIETQTQEFLGFRLVTLADIDYYVAVAGQFFLRSMLMLLSAAMSSLASLAVVGASVALIALLWRYRLLPIVRTLALAIALSVAVVQLLAGYLPALQVKDFLLQDVTGPEPDSVTVVTTSVEHLYMSHVCSRIRYMPQASAAKELGIVCDEEIDYAAERNLWYVRSLWVSTLVLSVILLVRATRVDGRSSAWTRSVAAAASVERPLLIATSTLLVGHGLSIAATYPRLAGDTTVNRVAAVMSVPSVDPETKRSVDADSARVSGMNADTSGVLEVDADASSGFAEGGRADEPEARQSGPSPEWIVREVLLLARSKDIYIFYERDKATIWMIAPEHVFYVEVIGVEDVLTQHILRNLNLETAEAVAPDATPDSGEFR